MWRDFQMTVSMELDPRWNIYQGDNNSLNESHKKAVLMSNQALFRRGEQPIDVDKIVELLNRIVRFAYIEDDSHFRDPKITKSFYRDFRNYMGVRNGEDRFYEQEEIKNFRVSNEWREDWQLNELAKLAQRGELNLEQLPPDFQVWTEQGYKNFSEVKSEILGRIGGTASPQNRNSAMPSNTSDSAMVSEQESHGYLDENEIANISFETVPDTDHEKILRRLVLTLGGSSGPLLQATIDKLKEFATRDQGLEKIRSVAESISNDEQTGWYRFKVENLIARTRPRNIVPEDFRFLNVDDKRIPLYAVHLTNLAPEEHEGELIMSAQRTPNRSTFHFSVNSKLESDWVGRGYAVIIPLADLIDKNRDNVIGGVEGDFVLYGPVRLPKETKVLKWDKTPSKPTVIQDQVVEYLKSIIGPENIFTITGWHAWKNAEEEKKKFRDLVVDHGLYYGHHGGHWTLTYELSANLFNEVFDLLEDRKSIIRTWLSSGGNPRLIEDISQSLPWWKKVSSAREGGIFLLIDKSIRSLMRAYVEHMDVGKEQLWQIWTQKFRSDIPVNERQNFDNLVRLGQPSLTRYSTATLEEVISSVQRTAKIPYVSKVSAAGADKEIWLGLLHNFVGSIHEESWLIESDFIGRHSYNKLLDGVILDFYSFSDEKLRRLFSNHNEFHGLMIDFIRKFTQQEKKQVPDNIQEIGQKLVDLIKFIFLDRNGDIRKNNILNSFDREANQFKLAQGHVFLGYENVSPPNSNSTDQDWVEKVLRDKIAQGQMALSDIPTDFMIWTSKGYQKALDVLSNVASTQPGDNAMLTPGGIDLNKTPLEIQNSNAEIKFNIDAATFEQLQDAPGFVPVIINIVPMSNLPLFLSGDKSSTPTGQLTMANQ